MNRTTTNPGTILMKLLSIAAMAASALLSANAIAAVQGVVGPTFSLQAKADYTSQPDGAQIYTWGYGCNGAATLQAYTGGSGPAPSCGAMQLPGPTLIVTEGDTVSVTLTNNLPAAAGNTSILFPGFQLTSTSGGVAGLRTQEAAPGNPVTYNFTATKPGTYAYYSGTQSDLQIEMGLFGAVVVRPAVAPTGSARAGCTSGSSSLASFAYDNDATCYDREFLFQFSEMDSRVHRDVLDQVTACPTAPCGALEVTMEPYRANYFLINGRSMPDLMDAPYSAAYPNQPYNGNPQIHPGEKLLMRVVGQGRWQHPFHFHGNHARVLAQFPGELPLADIHGKNLFRAVLQ